MYLLIYGASGDKLCCRFKEDGGGRELTGITGACLQASKNTALVQVRSGFGSTTAWAKPVTESHALSYSCSRYMTGKKWGGKWSICHQITREINISEDYSAPCGRLCQILAGINDTTTMFAVLFEPRRNPVALLLLQIDVEKKIHKYLDA